MANENDDDKTAKERADDKALAAGDKLNTPKAPTAAEKAAARRQAGKTREQLEQEAADAALRQGGAGVGAEFQPKEGQKPKFIKGGKAVNPDGKKATAKNLSLDDPGEEEQAEAEA